jgi:hypothetical protein
MEDPTTKYAAFGETIVFLSYFKDLKDSRQLLLRLLAALAGAETVTDIALFGGKKRELLRRFRPFKDGTTAHDHLGDILAILDAKQFQSCFVAWVTALSGAPEGAQPEGRSLSREHAGSRRQDRAADTLLHHLPDAARASAGADHRQPLDDRE